MTPFLDDHERLRAATPHHRLSQKAKSYGSDFTWRESLADVAIVVLFFLFPASAIAFVILFIGAMR